MTCELPIAQVEKLDPKTLGVELIQRKYGLISRQV